MKALFIALCPIVVAACGGPPNTPFIGTWTDNASETETCPSGNHVTPGSGNVTIVAGSAPTDFVTQSGNGCSLTWTASGNVGSLKGSQSCSVPGSVGGTWAATFTSGTLTLSGRTLTLSDSGSAVYTNGGVQDCTFTQSGTFAH